MEGPKTLEKLKKKLTIANVRTALNAGKFKEFVDDIRQFKKDEKIEGNLKDIVDTKTGDLPSLANKFDTLIPPSGILNPAEIDRTISALRSIKKLNKGLNTDIEFPRYRDIYPAYRDIPASKAEEKPKLRGSRKAEQKPKVEEKPKAEEKPTAEQEEEKEEQKPKEKKPERSPSRTQTSEPPTISADERDVKEEMEQEKKAQKEAKAERPTTGMTEEQEEELLDVPEKPNENVKMDMQKPDTKTEIDDLQPLPSKTDFIPPMRLGTRGKDIKELLEDIAYFMKNFKGQLKREAEIFKEVDKTNIEQLRKLHSKIVGKLAPKQKKEEGKKVGIIVNADEYIREQMKKILQEQTFSSLRPQDVVIDVGSKAAEGRDNKDFGDFEVKRTIDGGLASKREAVYRYMPTENDDEVGEEGKTEKQRRKPNRLSMPKPRLNNKRTTAIRMNVQNPFRVPQKTIKLKYLY